jgi:acetyl esterase/lipase
MKRKKWLWLLLLLPIIPLTFFPGFLFYTTAPIVEGLSDFNLAYNEKQALDIYFPTQKKYEADPVVVFIHGGAWITGRKESINFNRFNGAVEKLRAQGFAVVSPSYTLAEDGISPFPQNIKDVIDAVLWLKKNASAYELDSNRIGLLGESAGAHLGLMLAFHAYADAHPDWPRPEIDYLVDVYGPTEMRTLYFSEKLDSLNSFIEDLPAILREPLDISRNLMGFDPQKDSVKASQFMHEYSPINFLKPELPPVLIIHGDQDQLVSVEQSQLLVAKMDSLNLNFEYHELEGVNHAFLGVTDSQKDSIQFWISRFILKQYPLL